MAEDVIIKVNKVNKTFRLPHEKTTSIKSIFVNFWRRDKAYEKQRALNDVSFEINRGEFFGIVGRNGSGKSTLLKLLAGIYNPDSGDILVNGKLTPFIELGVGFNPELTGRENVFLNGALLGFSRKDMKEMYEDIVSFAELERFMDQKLKNYSSGMQVRLAFSIAIRAQSDILLIDEVLAVGDSRFQEKCFRYFYELKSNKQTVVFISHDLDAIKRFCDRAAFIDGGTLRFVGVAEEATERYRLTLFEEYQDEQKGNKSKDASLKNFDLKINGENELKHTDKLRLTFNYALDEHRDVEIRIAIVKDGLTFAHLNSRGNKLKSSPGKYSAELEIDLSMFMDGEFSIDYVLQDMKANKELAIKTHAASFYVVDGTNTRHGIMRLNAEWTKLPLDARRA